MTSGGRVGRRRLQLTRAGLVSVALLVAACGNRLTRAEIQAQNQVRVVGQSGAIGEEPGVGGPAQDGTSVGEGAVSPGQVAEDGTTGGPGTGERSPGGPQAPSEGQPGTASANKKPIVVGLVGYFSGIGGPVHIPKRDAWLVWEKMTNANGGINGHPVRVLVGDDGGSDSRAVSLARDFVENKGAIVLSTTGTTQGGVVTYADKKSIPVIGVGGGPNDLARKSPMMFQTAPSGTASAWGQAAVAKRSGVTRVAVIYCAESAECQNGSDLFASAARAQGLQVVAQMRASVTQPDFTAECIQARNARAELILPITDNTAPIRIAQSCNRQSYRPIFELGSASDAQADVPELQGAVVPSGAFPWFLRQGSPGVVEYAQAFKKYAPHRLTDGTIDQASAWVSAKILEAAAARVSETPTSRDLLNGLWSMKGATLDGLAQGGMARTYVRGRPTQPTFCTFPLKLQNKTWTAPRGLTPLCR